SVGGLNEQWATIQVNSTVQDRLSSVIQHPTGEFALIIHKDLQRTIQVSIDPTVSLGSGPEFNRLRGVRDSRIERASTSTIATDAPQCCVVKRHGEGFRDLLTV